MSATAPHTRRSDPKTSQTAARELATSGLAKTQRDLCLLAVRKSPGSTATEIAEAIDLERHAPSRRLPELRDAGLIINGPERRCRVLGRASITWLPAETPQPATPSPAAAAPPSFDPANICPCVSHRQFWRSIHGPHLICGECHPPIRESIVVEWVDVGEREVPPVVKHAMARANRKANSRRLPPKG